MKEKDDFTNSMVDSDNDLWEEFKKENDIKFQLPEIMKIRNKIFVTPKIYSDYFANLEKKESDKYQKIGNFDVIVNIWIDKDTIVIFDENGELTIIQV